MHWEKPTAKQDWKGYLTPQEAAELETIDRDAQKIDADRRDLTARRNLIVNRAIQRAKRRTA